MHFSCSFLAVFGTLGIVAEGSFMALVLFEELVPCVEVSGV